MANVLTGNPLIIDTVGIISVAPLVIQKIILNPTSSLGSPATLNYWLESNDPITNGTKNGVETTVTAATGTFSSTGNFPVANVNPFQIIKIIATSTGENLGRWQIATNADANTITVDGYAVYPYGQHVLVTDDTTETYTWKIWDPSLFMIIKAPSGSTPLVQVDFGDSGFWIPNLVVNTLYANAVLYIYLKNR